MSLSPRVSAGELLDCEHPQLSGTRAGGDEALVCMVEQCVFLIDMEKYVCCSIQTCSGGR